MDVDRDSYVDYACGWNRYTMKWLGIWPEERKFNLPSSYVALLPISLMTLLITVPQTINLYYIWGDFESIVENLSVANVTISISIVKTAIFWLSGKSIKILLTYMEKNRWQAKTEVEVRTLTRIAAITRKLSMACTVMCQSVVVLLLAVRIVLFRYTGRVLLYRAYYPFDAMVTPNFELTMILQIIAAVYAAVSYVAVDTFVAMLVLHVYGQLSNLRHQLHDICTTGGTMFHSRLADIVRKHESLNRFAGIIENKFSRMLLMQMIGCTLQLCVQSFQAVLTLTGEKDETYVVQMIFLGTYILCILFQIYLYCHIGEKLLTESTEIAYAAYNCEWYNMPAREVKLLIIIMRRARSPLRITAGQFCSFNHELFSNIVKTSMGYLSVLYNMKSKNID